MHYEESCQTEVVRRRRARSQKPFIMKDERNRSSKGYLELHCHVKRHGGDGGSEVYEAAWRKRRLCRMMLRAA